MRNMTSRFLDAVPGDRVPTGRVIVGIAPHAGFAYSGQVAAYTYRALQITSQRYQCPETVVVMGFSHRQSFHGISLLDADCIKTPSGQLDVNREMMNRLVVSVTSVFVGEHEHVGEHSAENQLPWIQAALPSVRVLVALMGEHDETIRQEWVEALQPDVESGRVCVIASTDLLHDTSVERVRRTDAETLKMMEKLDSQGLDRAWSFRKQVCCGIGPVRSVMALAKMSGCEEGTTLCYTNSADMTYDSSPDWVVGYGSVVYTL